jgi:hypothetical protein
VSVVWYDINPCTILRKACPNVDLSTSSSPSPAVLLRSTIRINLQDATNLQPTAVPEPIVHKSVSTTTPISKPTTLSYAGSQPALRYPHDATQLGEYRATRICGTAATTGCTTTTAIRSDGSSSGRYEAAYGDEHGYEYAGHARRSEYEKEEGPLLVYA